MIDRVHDESSTCLGDSVPGSDVAVVSHGRSGRSRCIALGVEFAVLFIAGPLAIAWWLPKRLLIPSIMLFGLLSLTLLLTDRTFDRRQLWNWRPARRELPRIILLAVLAGVAVTGLVLLVRPELVLSLVRRNPWLWLAIMLGYPLASVYPQEVIYRALIFHRYRPLFRSGMLTGLASAGAFGYAHIVLWNWIAIGATLIGGLLFAWTYSRSRSTAATTIEHAIYGCFMFTVGLGQYFYGGTVVR